VLGFAKQSGGGVRIESRLGEGTTVHIYLPRAEAKHALRAPESIAAVAGADIANAHILLVDDDNAVREITRVILSDLGYRVTEAGSGGAALDLIERESDIDLVIIDFAMPGMNGAEAARRIQSRRPTVPVLFVTGYADRSALGGIPEAQIIRKPFVDDDLSKRVRLALAGTGSSNVVRLRR
jgi:CheY-like chemotaxis protein